MRFFDSENVTLLMFSPKDVPRHVRVALTERYKNLSSGLWFFATLLTFSAVIAGTIYLREQAGIEWWMYYSALIVGLVVCVGFAITTAAMGNRRRTRADIRKAAFSGEYRAYGLVRSSDPSYRYLIAGDPGRRLLESLDRERSYHVKRYFGSEATIRADSNIKSGFLGANRTAGNGGGDPIDAYFNAYMHLDEQARYVINRLIAEKGGVRFADLYRRHFNAQLNTQMQELTRLEDTLAYKLRLARGQMDQFQKHKTRVVR